MRCFKLLCFIFVLHVPFICHAEATCPWINKATAFGILGSAENSAAAKPPEVSSMACSFSLQSGNEIRALHILVEQKSNPEKALAAYKNKCGHKAMPLPAIGNEAVMCPSSENHGEQVFGRVRDNVFSIVLTTTSDKDPFWGSDLLKEKIQLAAEQVAGNLF